MEICYDFQKILYPKILFMNQIFAFAVLLIILGSLVIIFVRKSKISKKVNVFYQQNHFQDVRELSDNIKGFFEDETLTPKQSVLVINNRTIPFYWIESSTKQTFNIIEANKPELLHYLTVVFPPATVSRAFMQQSIDTVDSSSGSISWNTDRIILAKLLMDGSFALKWRNIETTDNYEKKLAWLKANVN